MIHATQRAATGSGITVFVSGTSANDVTVTVDERSYFVKVWVLILVGVDPGKVTGVAIWWSPDHYDSEHTEIESAEVEHPGSVPAVIKRMLDGERPALLACERFKQPQGPVHMSAQPDAAQVVGMMRSLAEELHVRCVYQSPGPAKKIAPDALLRRIGWYVKTRDGHDNDARRHVLLLAASFFPETFASITGL